MLTSDRPNILLLMTDQQRFDSIAALGGGFGATTPAMDRLTRSGTVFDRAFCTAPICSPSRATIMTGLTPTQSGVYSNIGAPCGPLSAAKNTIGHRMQALGYQTAYHGKWHLGGTPLDFGFETGGEESHDATTVTEASRFWRNRDWLENKRPFFQVVSFLNPHDVYFFDTDSPVPQPHLAPSLISPSMRDDLKNKPFPQQNAQRPAWAPDRWQQYWRWYATCLETVDRQIDELLRELICSGYGPNTWIIFTADHADSAGEHGLPFKGPWMYDGVLRVPLVVIPPLKRFVGKGAGEIGAAPVSFAARSSRLTSLIDLVPTILDLAGGDADPFLPGRSLMPAVRGEQDAGHEAVFAEWHQSGRFVSPIRCVRTASHKYTQYLGYGEELYDLDTDPLEMTNLAHDPAHADELASLRKRLSDHLRHTADLFLSFKPTNPMGGEINFEL